MEHHRPEMSGDTHEQMPDDAERLRLIEVKNKLIQTIAVGRISDALMIKEGARLTEDIFQDPDVQQAAKAGMIVLLASGYVDGAVLIKKEFNLPEDLVLEVAKAGMIVLLVSGNVNEAVSIKKEFNLPENIFTDPEVQQAAKAGMIKHLASGHVNEAVSIKKEFNLPEDLVLEAAKAGMIKHLASGNVNKAVSIKKAFNLPENIFTDPEVQQAAKAGMIVLLASGNVDGAVSIKKAFNLPEDTFTEPEVQQAAKAGMIKHLVSGNIPNAVSIKKAFNLPEDLVLEAAKAGMIKHLASGNVNKAVSIKKEFNLPEDILKDPQVELAAIFSTTKATTAEEKEFLDLDRYTEEQLRGMWVQAKEQWFSKGDTQLLAESFEAGAEVFGFKKMLVYIKRNDLSFHDAVHALRDILKLYRASGLDESEFYGKVLHQVVMDEREYSEGNAHHHINAIAQTANSNVGEVLEKAQGFKDIKKLQDLVMHFSSPQTVFASWANVKRYSELEQLLGQTEILKDLKELKELGKEKLYRYVEELAFHPDSKVNMGAVVQFWRDPEAYFAAAASHTPAEIHDRKKPSNYLHMPNLDLTAVELRDALVEGNMDSLSVFTPFEIRYTIPMEDIKHEPLPESVRMALGSSKQGITGAARNPKKLFGELQKLLREHSVTVPEYIEGKVEESTELSTSIEALLYNREFGMGRPVVKTREFVARISQKSDPQGAIAGDDTVNCMPFGDGKNTVYSFNPNTAQFVVRMSKDGGGERTFAQSVLTKDVDIKTPVPTVISRIQSGSGHLADILPADILENTKVFLACDNVEVAPNYSGDRYKQILEVIYRDFFKEYIARYADTQGLDRKMVPIGLGHTDALSTLPKVANTYAPQAPVSYSDKTGEIVSVLDLESGAGAKFIHSKEVREFGVRARAETPLPNIKGIGYLTFEDTLKVAYLEGKAYSDNKSLMQFLFNVENGLIAKDINNAAKNRPNMSLSYTDDAKKMRGYILAWEGKLTDSSVEYEAKEFFGESCVYIADLATDRENAMAGGRLIQGFTELYKQNYLDKGNMMPIYAQARESTSYKIIQRQLQKLGNDIGVDFELVELPTYTEGGDVMHPVIIKPVRRS